MRSVWVKVHANVVCTWIIYEPGTNAIGRPQNNSDPIQKFASNIHIVLYGRVVKITDIVVPLTAMQWDVRSCRGRTEKGEFWSIYDNKGWDQPVNCRSRSCAALLLGLCHRKRWWCWPSNPRLDSHYNSAEASISFLSMSRVTRKRQRPDLWVRRRICVIVDNERNEFSTGWINFRKRQRFTEKSVIKHAYHFIIIMKSSISAFTISFESTTRRVISSVCSSASFVENRSIESSDALNIYKY